MKQLSLVTDEVELKTGVFNLPEEQYHGLKLFSKSGSDVLAKGSPAHFKAWQSQPNDPTDAMMFGSAFHCAMLEHHLFDKKVWIKPEGFTARSDANKAILAQAKAENKIVLSQEQAVSIVKMAGSVRSQKSAAKLLQKGKAEQSLIWKDPEHDVLCKARLDYITADDIIIDVKTAQSAAPGEFQRTVLSNRYHVQAAMYIDGLLYATGTKAKKFVLVVVEKAEPFAVAVYELNEAWIYAGRQEYRNNLAVYAQCFKTNVWPSYPEQVQTLSTPGYMKVDSEGEAS